MSLPRFKIYNASAGSGKTYSLVQNFLTLCLGNPAPNNFRNILAITFTNKAADEMKTRIVATLVAFSRMPVKDAKTGMFGEIMKDTGLSVDSLRNRSREVLRILLHQYSSLSVSTIDKFTNRLIRSFSHDLKLSSFYEVELDSTMMLSEAVDKMLSELEENSPTARVLIEFLNTQLEQGRSPRAENQLIKTGKCLFEERALEPIEKLRHLQPPDYLQIRHKLQQRNLLLEEKISKIAGDFLHCIEQAGIDHSCFSGSYLPKYLKKLKAKGSLDLPSKTVMEQLSGDRSFYPKSKAKDVATLFIPVENELIANCRLLLDHLYENYALYQISDLILKSIYSLAVLMEIEANLEDVKSATNTLPIGEFNKLVSRKLQNEPAAFIYEKLGDRYQNFFIDEFQDTSRLQWQNLIPLINNSLAESGTAMIVGDGKQSIYRWRGGEVEQFLDLNSGKDSSNKVSVNDNHIELYSRENIFLPHNWRSRKNIVEFNNAFFKSIVEVKKNGDYLVGKEEHRQLFRNAEQKVRGGEGGYVDIRMNGYVDGISSARWQGVNCLEIINKALDRGYRLSDIAILNRKKSNSQILAEFLIDQNIPVISPDSLLLNQSGKVMAVISLLKIIVRPDDRSARIPFLDELWKLPQIVKEYKERHVFFRRWLKMSQEQFFTGLSSLWPEFDLGEFTASTLSGKISTTSRFLGYELLNDPFLHALQDEAQNFDQHREEGINGFLRWWENKGFNVSIELSDKLDAVRLMTIHKAKGLEFPVVILAFADWMAFQEREPVTWLKLDPEKYFGLPAARVGLKALNSEMRDMEDYTGIYSEYRNNVVLDNLNLLYVALTRPVDELYILGTSNHQDDQRISVFLKYFLAKNEGSEKGWTTGKQLRSEQKPGETIGIFAPSYTPTTWKDRIKVTTDAPLNWHENIPRPNQWGRKIHSILARVKTADMASGVLENFILSGDFSTDEVDELNTLVNKVVTHPELKVYFGSEVEVMNEKDILIPGAGSFRPDRLVLQGEQYHIIDYKTGKATERHQQQLNGYENLLMEMGLKTGNKVLAYLGEEVEVLKW